MSSLIPSNINIDKFIINETDINESNINESNINESNINVSNDFNINYTQLDNLSLNDLLSVSNIPKPKIGV